MRGRVIGVAWALLAVAIWAGWIVVTALGVSTSLSPADLALLRTGIPALLLAPVLWRHRARLAAAGWRLVPLAGYGLPFTLAGGYGLQFAPVAHGGAMIPGLMPVLAAAMAAATLGERLVLHRITGLALIVGAVATLVLAAAGPDPDPGRTAPGPLWPGHLLFVVAALGWASFTVAARALALSPYLSTAAVGLISAMVLGPLMLVVDLGSIAQAPWREVLGQGLYQGVLAGVISLYAYAQAIAHLGAASAAAFASLVPVVAGLLAIPVLGQIPGPLEVIAAMTVSLGVWLASRPDRRPYRRPDRRAQAHASTSGPPP